MDFYLEIWLNYPFEYNVNDKNKHSHASDAHSALLDNGLQDVHLTKHFKMVLLKQMDK